MMTEADRIRAEYARRERVIAPERYTPTNLSNLFLLQQRTRIAIHELSRRGMTQFLGKTLLEVGCGRGGWLPLFEEFGVARGDLAGIELDASRAAVAAQRLCAHRDDNGAVIVAGADIRCGDATALPWADDCFDIVVQSTVFTSVLDEATRRAIAAEMVRVLRPGGMVIWYDFIYNNPYNLNVRGIGKREIYSLFPTCRICLRRITLAPPIARRLVPISWLASTLLETLQLFNTHYLGLLLKPTRSKL